MKEDRSLVYCHFSVA